MGKKSKSVLITGSPTITDLSEKEQIKPIEVIEFKTTKYRWVILPVYCGLVFSKYMVLTGFASMVDPIKTAFGVKNIWITVMLSMPHYIYLPMHFVTSQLFLKLEPIRVFQLAIAF